MSITKEEAKKRIRDWYFGPGTGGVSTIDSIIDQIGEEREHRWDFSSNHPELKRCVICGEKDVSIEAGDGVCRGLYRAVCCGDHVGSMTAWFASRHEAIAAWNSNLSPIEMQYRTKPGEERERESALYVAARDFLGIHTGYDKRSHIHETELEVLMELVNLIQASTLRAVRDAFWSLDRDERCLDEARRSLDAKIKALEAK